jgi:dTDP-3-amino-3,4,6-trideoxy-alpha-D-glucose transaminase
VTAARIGFGTPAPREEGPAVAAAIDRVVKSGWFVLGPEVEAFEREFAAAQGARWAVGVGNGTDALALILRALDIGAGDEVITSPLSAAFTALAIMSVGATPIFADIDSNRMTIDPAAISHAVTPRTRAIMPVHLYGQPADMAAIEQVAARHHLPIVEDCCQAHLATASGRAVGTIGVAGAFSFYPTKNLGALGDGGAVVTQDAALADRIKRLRNGGQLARYQHVEPGVNSRLDEIQAAILRARLERLPEWTARRRALAASYRARLAPEAATTTLPPECDPGHVYHLFVVRSRRRAALREYLHGEGIETLVHYPTPIPSQPALAQAHPAACPRAAAACDEVLSLPLHPWLTDSELADVAAAVCGFDRSFDRRD